jgi:activating signal cointegrator 1
MRGEKIMQAITLYQPYATAILVGKKKIDTRSWKTNHRGTIAIHAAKVFPKFEQELLRKEMITSRLPPNIEEYSFGAIICLADITDVRATEDLYFEIGVNERRYGNYSKGRWGWILTNIRPLLKPIKCNGRQKTWKVPFTLYSQMVIK